MAKRRKSKSNNKVSLYTHDTLNVQLQSGMSLQINYDPLSVDKLVYEDERYDTNVYPLTYKAGILTVNDKGIRLIIEVDQQSNNTYTWLMQEWFTWDTIFNHARVNRYPLISGVYVNRYETKPVRYSFAVNDTVSRVRSIVNDTIEHVEELRRESILINGVSWLGRQIKRLAG